MSNPNVPPTGAIVNPSPYFGGRQFTKAAKAAAKAASPDPGNAPGRGRPKKKDVDGKTTTTTTTEPPGPSLSKQWADRLLGDKRQPWFAEANHTSGGVAVHRWNGSYLQFIGSEEGSAMAADWLDLACPHKASEAAANSAWAFGAKRLRTQRVMPVQDRRRNLIPCGDVYLEMTKDGITAIAPDPAMGMTYAVNLKAGTPVGQRHKTKPLAANSRFGAFLENALPDPEVRALVQEQCGLTLLPANFQIASWWVGAAGTGKSTLVELCKAMQRQVACISLDDLGTPFGLEGLVGASVVQVDEVEAEKWAEGKFKSLVSGNGVSINRKNEKALMDYSLRAKWLITSNAKPFVRDKSDGVWRRLCIVPFEVVIPEEERVPDFHNILLEDEGAQILDWMLEGAQRLVCRGRFMPEHERPDAVRDLKEDSRNDCDSVRAWVGAWSVCVGEEWQTKDAVYDAYEAWCIGAHQEPLPRRVFWKGLRGQVPGIQDANLRRSGKQTNCVSVAMTPPAVLLEAPPIKAPPIRRVVALVPQVAPPPIEHSPITQGPNAVDDGIDWGGSFSDLPYAELFERPKMQGRG